MDYDKSLTTEKQFEFAKAISETLDVEMPQDFTKESYSEFINHYKDEYYKIKELYPEDDYDEHDDNGNRYSWER